MPSFQYSQSLDDGQADEHTSCTDILVAWLASGHRPTTKEYTRARAYLHIIHKHAHTHTHTLSHTNTHTHTHTHHANTRACAHGYLVCLVDVGPLVKQQLDDLEVAVQSSEDEAGPSVLNIYYIILYV